MAVVIPHGFEPNYTLGFVRGLRAAGIDVVLVSGDDSAAQAAAAGITQINLRGNQSEARPLLTKLGGLLRYYARLFRFLHQQRGEVIHFCGLLDRRLIVFDGLVLTLALRLCAARYIHTAHNALPHGRHQSRLFRALYRWIYRLPHTIIAHSSSVADELHRDFGVPRERLRVISIGLNEEVPATDLSATEARRRLGLPPAGPLALFFGKIEPYKGLDLLAAAWARVSSPAANLVIAGWCPDPALARDLRARFGIEPGRDRVHWREGFVPNEEVGLLLGAADVVVLPYRRISQSGVIFLCLRFGVPIVATRVGSMADFIDAESGLLAAPEDPGALAAALDQVFAEPDRFDRSRILSRAAPYRWEAQCAQLRDLYHRG
jgi:glycosyltransferase involved in cell wall biosynthesis